MKIANTRFDDPKHLGEPNRIFIDTMMRFELLDYARRYFERKGDKSSMERAKEIRKLYKQTIRDCTYLVRSIIPEEVMHDFYDAREMYMKGREKSDSDKPVVVKRRKVRRKRKASYRSKISKVS